MIHWNNFLLGTQKCSSIVQRVQLNPNDKIIKLNLFLDCTCTTSRTTNKIEMHGFFLVSISIYSYLLEKSEQLMTMYLVKLHKTKAFQMNNQTQG